LEVVDLSGDSTVWHKRFSTDRDAYADFQRALSTGGIRSLLEKPPGQSLH
jgi:hypothetical protein